MEHENGPQQRSLPGLAILNSRQERTIDQTMANNRIERIVVA